MLELSELMEGCATKAKPFIRSFGTSAVKHEISDLLPRHMFGSVESYPRSNAVVPRRVPPMAEIQVNQIGEPCGLSEYSVTRELRSIVRKLVPVTTMWSSVTKEVRYKIVQELQGRFSNGWKLDSTWIKIKAGKLLASDRGRAKTVLWRKHSSLYDGC